DSECKQDGVQNHPHDGMDFPLQGQGDALALGLLFDGPLRARLGPERPLRGWDFHQSPPPLIMAGPSRQRLIINTTTIKAMLTSIMRVDTALASGKSEPPWKAT